LQLRGAAGSAFEGGVFPYANSISGAVTRLAANLEVHLCAVFWSEVAKLPNGNAPNYLTETRQIT